jgi:predicted DNA binding protein
MSMRELSKRLGISQPKASQSIRRGEKVVAEQGLKLEK